MMNAGMTISPADPEFERIADTLGRFLDDLDERNQRIVYKTEASFREFCAYAVQSIAASLGYTLTDIAEFIKDMGASWSEGWRSGRDRARRASLRYRGGV
jgi:hypothetical protein